MFSNTEQTKQLYVPDFKLWNDYYEKKVNKQQVHDQILKPSCPGQSNDKSKVQLKLISPIAQTTDQAESIMKTDGHKVGKKIKIKKSKVKTKSKGKNTLSRKQKGVQKSAFTYRKLKDIFSKGKK